MAVLEILKYPHPKLKRKSLPIETIDDNLRRLIADMAETMYAAPGVGLAAPQVGHSLRLAVIDVTPANEKKNLLVLLNPEILSAEGECTWDEGCLSVPDYNEDVKRKEKVVVRYRNPEGKTCEIEAEGLLAVALQHELDHLDGILFIDRISSLKRALYRRKLQKEKKEKEKEGKKL
jgi:peptide deformylase